MDRLFQIGDFCFRVLSSCELPLPDNFLLFEIKNGEPEYTYRISTADALPLPEGKILAQRPDLLVYGTSGRESRLLGIRGRSRFYALYQETSDTQAEVVLSLPEIANLNIDPVFASLFALERRMIPKDSLILHCAYIEYQKQAILFSGPSGTGKSTQADLWRRYRGSHIVNGDRALLRKSDGQWFSGSWPVCGSSGICCLDDRPVRAIVMLRQGKNNQVERLSPVQAFAQLYAQVTINQWNRDFVQRAMTILEDLIRQVPVFQLTCDMTEDAVQCLESVLSPGTEP